ncbi:hypothetical protein [Loigolactobacillus backii]|uniref:Uncharacterized protein n=1 Tax=Loigolactobacillus backii TaxID=375175 RepID=A0A192H1G2_9LACO|nr:hypothetical protein [Loigolactobacillus backii]ANK62200.1 hypothetical protein AYR53_05080 [Loigolactobacillus backii]ANK70785.1 hypothetical protein AYR56_11905 [Loigolactobacillus backii]MDA5387397.1 hypothetical protein [Loigolactobacillus backii]MDA5389936.1 hypothetical protein [Loigolactobacillus backii]PIO82624.1 hypothetical protein BSQ39_03085 [Loigolactobacillus backii]
MRNVYRGTVDPAITTGWDFNGTNAANYLRAHLDGVWQTAQTQGGTGQPPFTLEQAELDNLQTFTQFDFEITRRAALNSSFGQWYQDFLINLLTDKTKLKFWPKKQITDHGLAHFKHDMYYCLLLAQLDQMAQRDALVLLLTAALHDIGRFDNTAETSHGELAVEKFLALFEMTKQTANYTALTTAFNLQVLAPLNSTSNAPIPELTKNDMHTILDLVAYHCRDEQQAAVDFKAAYNDRAAGRRIRLLAYFKDADALDRVRFAGLDVGYLRQATSKRLVSIAWQAQAKI